MNYTKLKEQLPALKSDLPIKKAGVANTFIELDLASAGKQCQYVIEMPVELTLGENLSVTIQLLYPGIYQGYQADWWCVADTPLGWYYYNHSDSDACLHKWLPGFIVSYQGPLGEVSPPLEVLNSSDLPFGSYTFYFGVDLCRNGKLNKKYLYYNSVEVKITP